MHNKKYNAGIEEVKSPSRQKLLESKFKQHRALNKIRQIRNNNQNQYCNTNKHNIDKRISLLAP
jgi:hypothetical protein